MTTPPTPDPARPTGPQAPAGAADARIAAAGTDGLADVAPGLLSDLPGAAAAARADEPRSARASASVGAAEAASAPTAPAAPAEVVNPRPAASTLLGLSRSTGLPWWVPALAGLLGLALVAFYAQNRLGRVERELARRVQQSESREQHLDKQVKQLSDALRDAQGRSAVVEAKLADALGQQAQLKQLYDQMALSRGDAMLADAENSVMIAAQQLQLGGNVQSALLALQDAEHVLARSNQPALIGVRRHLARDIERLKAMPLTDFAAAVSKLDGVIAAAEQLPLLADVNPPARAVTEEVEPTRDGLLGLPERVARTGAQGFGGFVNELRSLVRVQRLDRPEALLLSPEQRFFARENLRLMLLNARLNLLARNESLFRSDLARARGSLERWFDVQNRQVAGSIGSLRQLEATALVLQMPSLAETIAAMRAARAAGESR